MSRLKSLVLLEISSLAVCRRIQSETTFTAKHAKYAHLPWYGLSRTVPGRKPLIIRALCALSDSNWSLFLTAYFSPTAC